MVPGGILAVVVYHVVALHPPHRRVLLGAEPAARRRRRHRTAARWRRRSRAPPELEPGELRDEGLVAVVGSVPAVVRRPRRRVPNGAVHPHGPVGERRLRLPRVPPYRHVVDQESERPQDPSKAVQFCDCCG
ncbi:hypothetical protein B296_00041835 [Ensete ventricosum]|uniref:Uncharacterized protein n=1 Tax=Ensete ventricosum TaxID=4639 RepID=A0A426XYP0_ENSVE|nr:hypothetical protein B296_00041835 [Ensete ventricosum]